MRIALSLLALLFCIPGNVWAGAILKTQFLNSDLRYGTGAPYQSGYDGDSVWLNGAELWDSHSGTYEAWGAAFVRQTLIEDAAGGVSASEYLYQGGAFRFDIEVDHGGGDSLHGTFVAPIIELRVLTAEPSGSPDAWYLLGPGTFDGPIARALGIGTHTLGGDVFIDMIAPIHTNNFGLGIGDYTSPVRGAWDGYTIVNVELPEPPVAMLSVVAAITVWLRRRSRP